ncbi:MAG: AAA family ATPase [Thaumarchaeota archaeon]|nr:AAA family ATPase [Nitrososphaerota archaeon]
MSENTKMLAKLDGLAEFLQTGGNTLLIKGDAGTGKTTLALQLMHSLAGKDGGVYISARVSKEKLRKHNSASTQLIGEGGFVDLRLGNSSFIVSAMIKAIKGRGKKTKVIVVDTWDAFAKEMEEKERIKAEKALMALVDTTDARIIFVSEEPERTSMEYLVDGIAILRRLEENGALLREFELTKLRGTPIDQHKHLFTLDGGTFTALEYRPHRDFSKAHTVKPLNDTRDAFSFGTLKLDHLFGGIPKGSTFALVYDGNVPYACLRIVELLSIINALNLGHGAFLLPLPSSPLQDISDRVRPYVSRDAFNNNFAVASMERDDERLEPPFYAVGADSDHELFGKITGLIEKVRKNSKTGNVLSVESMVQLESTFASSSNTVLEGLSARISKIQATSNDALLVMLHSDAQMKARFLAMSRRYARIFMKDRATIIVGEKPSTEPYVLEHDDDNPLLPSLTRIV